MRTSDPVRDQRIIKAYASRQYTTQHIARAFAITTRRVQQLAAKAGIVRTRAEGNRAAAPLKNKRRIRTKFRPKDNNRVPIPARIRQELLRKQPFCALCGSKDNLDIDHMDNNPRNSILENLQVLCNPCNVRKAHAYRRAVASVKMPSVKTMPPSKGDATV